MKIIKHDLDIDDKVLIAPVADLHIGDRHVAYKDIAAMVNMIRETPHMFWIGDGDFMNAAIAGSKSNFYEEELRPMEALSRCVELFEPIKDKCLALLIGNHEERISRSVGVDIVRLMARELGLEEIYSETSALIFLKFGENIRQRKLCYTIYVNHGNGGGKYVPGKLRSLDDMGRIVPDADVFVCGHTHLPAAYKKSVVTCNRSNCSTSVRDQLYVNTCSMLDWSGGYGDRKGYQPSSKALPIITLDNRTMKATVTL